MLYKVSSDTSNSRMLCSIDAKFCRNATLHDIRSSLRPPSSLNARVHQLEDPEQQGGDHGGCWNRQHPSPNDPACHAPTHSRNAMSRADAHDGAGNGVCGAHGNPIECGSNKGKCRGTFRAESAHRLELGDLRPHSPNDAPSAKVRP